MGPMRRAARVNRHDAATDVLMVLENNGYPLDSRVRKEAETLVESGLTVEVLAPRDRGQPVREVIGGVHVTRFALHDGEGALFGTAIEYLAAFFRIGAIVLSRLARSPRGTLHVPTP